MPSPPVTTVAASPVPVSVKTGTGSESNLRLLDVVQLTSFKQFQSLGEINKLCKLSISRPNGLGLRIPSDRRNSFICSATSTQTLSNETRSKTTSKAPDWNKIRKPDDGNKIPPRDGGGGGGGGGGGSNFSGGWILFGILLFLDFLKDKEKEKGTPSVGEA